MNLVVWLCAFHFHEAPELNADSFNAPCAMQCFIGFSFNEMYDRMFPARQLLLVRSDTEKRVGSGPISRHL